MPLFHYSINDCDVSDRGELARFRSKLEQWNDLLNGDEAHAITGQINDMMWQDAAWRSANEARRYTEEDGPNASVAPLVGAMLDRGYVAGQVIAISRLLEYSDPKRPARGVVSLRRLLGEVMESRHLITRENFVAQDALPYDFEAVERAENQKLFEHAEANGGVFFSYMPTEGPLGWDAARRQHELFDAISAVEPEARQRSDVIADAFFTRLDTMLSEEVFSDVLALRNKSVAHAADAFSRAQAVGLREGLKLDEFAKAHFILLAVYQVLSVVLLGTWRGSAVPIPQDDQFAHLTDCFVREQRLSELRAFWKAHCAEREGWMSEGYREVIPRKDERARQL